LAGWVGEAVDAATGKGSRPLSGPPPYSAVTWAPSTIESVEVGDDDDKDTPMVDAPVPDESASVHVSEPVAKPEQEVAVTEPETVEISVAVAEKPSKASKTPKTQDLPAAQGDDLSAFIRKKKGGKRAKS